MLKHKGTQMLETERLLLRRAVAADAQPMFDNWASDAEVVKYLTWPVHGNLWVTRKVLGFWISDYERRDFYQWMIVLKELGEPIGTISVVSFDEEKQTAELGYCLGQRWWHRGLMSEALQEVIRFLFEEVGVGCIEAKHDRSNPRSGAVMRRCGMEYQGIIERAGQNNQGLCDLVIYRLFPR